MTGARRSEPGHLSVLSLEVQMLDDWPNWPVVQIRADGENPFAGAARDWQGFAPTEMLGSDTPLLPVNLGRRVAVYRCSCGEAGCGVIAPVIVPSPDGRRISWVDFRDYVGVFARPISDATEKHDGEPWAIRDLHFDRQQYIAEIERASRAVTAQPNA